MNPLEHSKISVKRRGGKIEDYYPIHFFLDSTKELCSDNRHRVLHNLWRIKGMLIEFYGVIREVEKSDSLISVESFFGIMGNRIFDWKKKAKGFGQTLQEAFENSLDRWLEMYLQYLIPVIKGETTL